MRSISRAPARPVRVRAAAVEPREQCGEHVGRPVADGKNLARRLDLGRHAFGFEQLDQVARPESGQGRVQETALAAVGSRMMPRLSVACVRLQRVPPDIRILTPGLRFFSKSSVRRPRSAARAAASNPAAPAPMTTNSQSKVGMEMWEENPFADRSAKGFASHNIVPKKR